MARIREYTPQVEADTIYRPHVPYASESDFGGPGEAILGESIQHAGNVLYDQAQRSEVSDAQVKLAQKRAQWTKALSDATANGQIADPNFTENFTRQVNDDVSSLSDGYSTLAGQRAVQVGTAEMVSNLSQSAAMHGATARANLTVANYQQYLDAQRNTLMSDPSQFQSTLRDTSNALDDPAGPYATMPAAQRENLHRATKNALAQATVEGMFRLNPQGAMDSLKRGDFDSYLDNNGKYMLESRAQMFINAQAVEQNRVAIAQEKALRKAQEATENGFVTKLVTDPSSLSTKDILNSNLSPPEKLGYIKMLQTALSPNAIQTDPQVFQSLFERIHLPDGDPRKLTDPSQLNQFFGNGLDMPTLKTLRTEMAGTETPDGKIESQLRKNFYDTVKSTLTGTDPLLHLKDPKGDEQMLKFMSWYLPEYNRQRAAGKSAIDLLNPESNDYIGKGLQQYERSPQQKMRDLISSNPEQFGGVGGVKPPAVGELRDGYKFKGGDPSKPESWEKP